ncbi:MAG: hypothetical protein ACYC2Y_08775 [Armatimonadota bacterium]
MENRELDFVRGKTAQTDVRDFEGNVVVSSGERVTDELAERVQEEGLLQELVLSVGAPEE